MKIRNQTDVLQRLPCLTAHLIAESLGTSRPRPAANAIAYQPRAKHFSANGSRLGQQARDRRDTVKEVGELAIQNAVRRRGSTSRAMAQFRRALAIAFTSRQGNEGPCLHRGSIAGMETMEKERPNPQSNEENIRRHPGRLHQTKGFPTCRSGYPE